MKKLLNFILIFFMFIFLVSCSKSIEIKIYTDDINNYDSVLVNKGDVLPEPNEPYKYGYIFVEWQADGIKYNFYNKVTKKFSLTAKFEKISSESVNSAKLLFPTSTDEVVMELAGVIQKNDIDVEKLVNDVNSFGSLLDFTLNENDISGIVEFFITYIDTLIKYDFEHYNILSLSENSKEIIQSLYSDLKVSSVYNSDYVNFDEDLLFCEVILPIIIANYDSYNGNVYLWLLNNTLINKDNNYILKEYSIYRLYEKVRFLNNTNNNSYTITFNEIENIINYIDNYNNISLVVDVITEYNTYYLNSLEEFRFVNNKNSINNNSENLKNVIEENSEILNGFLVKLKDSYNIINGLQEKYYELKEDIMNIQSLEGLKETVYGFVDFKDQVLMSLKASIPSNEEIDCLNTIIKSLNVDDYFKTKINKGLFDRIIYFINNISAFIKFYEKIIIYLEGINNDNYNIDIMIESYYNDDMDTFNKEYDRMKADLAKVTENIKIFDVSTYQKFKESIGLLLPINCSSINDLINVLFGVPGSENFIENYYNDYNGFSDVLNAENEMSILKYLYKQSYGEITYEDIDEVAVIIDNIIDNINPNIFYKTNNLVVYIYNSLYEYDDQKNITADFKVIRDNIDTFKSYYKLYFHILAINELKQNTKITDKEIALKHFKYLKDNLTDKDIQSFIYLFNKFNNNIEKIEVLNNNYLNKIEEVIIILKEDNLSDSDIEYVNEIGSIFNICI